MTVLKENDHLATNIIWVMLWKRALWASEMVFKPLKIWPFNPEYINLGIQNYFQILEECLSLFACTKKKFTREWSLLSKLRGLLCHPIQCCSVALTHAHTQFLQQYHHYQSLLHLFLVNPSQQSEQLEKLVMFLSQVSNLNFYWYTVPLSVTLWLPYPSTDYSCTCIQNLFLTLLSWASSRR